MDQFKNVTDPEKRVQMLEDNCYGKEEVTYQKRFTPEQMQEIKEQYIVDAQVLYELEQEKIKFMEDWKLRAQPVKDILGEAMTKIKFKSEMITEEVYLIDDQPDKIMFFVNAEGETVDQRPLLKKEQQAVMKFSKVAGSDLKVEKNDKKTS